MNEAEYARFCETEPAGYGAEMAAAGEWSAAEAPARAQAEFERLLPEGRATPGHHVRTIRRAEDDAVVGLLWWSYRPAAAETECFIWDIAIDPAFRRRGYASAALAALEAEARDAGALQVSLHVFGGNRGAIALYERIGYRSTHLKMSKPLR